MEKRNLCVPASSEAKDRFQIRHFDAGRVDRYQNLSDQLLGSRTRRNLFLSSFPDLSRPAPFQVARSAASLFLGNWSLIQDDHVTVPVTSWAS
jgi:hypothetical protein